MVHKRVNGDGALAVVSVFFEDAGTFPSPFLSALTAKSAGLPRGDWDEVSVNFAAADLRSGGDAGFQALLRGSPFFGYEGSLTVPPCETGVRHFVRQLPQPASSAQLRQFAELMLELSPPHGNYRARPPTSAGQDLVLIGSVDMGSGIATPPAQLAGGISATAEDSQAAASNPDFGRLLPGDSPELVRAKERYQQALQELRAATHDKSSAERGLHSEEALYNASVGLEAKLQAKARAQSAAAEIAAADSRILLANAALGAATGALLKAHGLESVARRPQNPDGVAEVRATPAPPIEPGSDGRVATTRPAFTFGLEPTEAPRGPLRYRGPEVVLPEGLSANPFVDGPAAQARVAIGAKDGQAESGGLSTHGAMKLAPNLRQYDGPEGSVQVPEMWAKFVEMSTSLRRGHAMAAASLVPR